MISSPPWMTGSLEFCKLKPDWRVEWQPCHRKDLLGAGRKEQTHPHDGSQQ